MAALTRSAQDVIGRWPALYVAMLHLKYRNHPFRQRVVSRDTDITIEGFPRSGNSFANRAFASAQPGPVKIATHAHHAAQVRRSASLGKPTLVVVRDPARSIPSLYALREESRRAEPGLTPVDVEQSLARYAAFHEDVLKAADSILLVRFEEVIEDYGRVIDRLNRRFGTSFARFEHTEENVQRLFAEEGKHLSPSEDRRRDNEVGTTRYREAPPTLRSRAEAAYHRVAAVADQQGSAVQ